MCLKCELADASINQKQADAVRSLAGAADLLDNMGQTALRDEVLDSLKHILGVEQVKSQGTDGCAGVSDTAETGQEPAPKQAEDDTKELVRAFAAAMGIPADRIELVKVSL